jgi:hypothetical protein
MSNGLWKLDDIVGKYCPNGNNNHDPYKWPFAYYKILTYYQKKAICVLLDYRTYQIVGCPFNL